MHRYFHVHIFELGKFLHCRWLWQIGPWKLHYSETASTGGRSIVWEGGEVCSCWLQTQCCSHGRGWTIHVGRGRPWAI